MLDKIRTLDRREVLTWMFFVGLLQISLYYLIGSLVRGDGGFAIGQPDTLLYCQAARRIAEGCPFSFSDGSAVCTGTTSVLYPFLLAIPAWLGCSGDALLRAGFALNALFLLVFLVGWGLNIHEFYRERPLAMVTALGLVSVFAPCIYCILAQCDVGLWMAVSSFIAWGFLSKKRWVYGPLLVLGPWLRPEGMGLVVAFAIVGMLAMFWKRSPDWRDLVVGGLGIFSIGGVFLLNYALTGEAQFASVANKGHGTNYPMFQAIYVTAVDGMRMAKAYLLGSPWNAPRFMTFLPGLGAIALWLGVFGHDWRNSPWRMLAWLMGAVMSFGMVSASGFQDLNLDRYLAWTFPLLLLLMAEGCEYAAKKFGSSIGWGLSVSNVIFTLVMAAVFASLFGVASEKSDRYRAFAARCEKEMRAGSAVGLWSHAGVAFEFSNRRIAQLCGIYSPEFRTRSPIAAVEILKREPKTRFDYFFWDCADCSSIFGDVQDVLFGEQVLIGPDGFELRIADWKALDAAETSVKLPISGVKLQDRVDVGYEIDEISHGYTLLSQYHMPTFKPFLQSGKLAGQTIVEGGRLVFGGDEMTIAAQPGKDLRVVMRTYPHRAVAYDREINAGNFIFKFKESLNMEVTVDGERAVSVSVNMDKDGFSDINFVIPAKAIKTDRPCIAFLGDHISCGYWFYQ